MKAGELLEISGIEPLSGGCKKSLTGKELLEVNKIIKLESLDEFKNSSVKVIEEINIVEQEVITSETEVSFKGKSEPELINIMDGEGLKFSADVEIYSMFISTNQDGKDILIYRVTPESIEK